jgi:hypothetical protein
MIGVYSFEKTVSCDEIGYELTNVLGMHFHHVHYQKASIACYFRTVVTMIFVIFGIKSQEFCTFCNWFRFSKYQINWILNWANSQ